MYENSGFVSEEGSFENQEKAVEARGEIAIVTFWSSFDQHEASHADALFKEKFSALLEYCDDANEIGYKMLWQGVPEDK